MEGEALNACLEEMGEKRFRGKQIISWLHGALAEDYDQMTNLSKALRARLSKEAPLMLPVKERVFSSQIDETQKYLFRLSDGQLVESVLMKHSYGYSACISSQAGCAMGCRFCASGIGGFVRDLTAGEMLGQVYAMQRDLFQRKERVSHIVVMGTGEPLLNLDNLLAFIRILSDEKGQRLSRRNMTVSTCGIVPGIERLSQEGLPITLALSLHAATQEKRKEIMPIAKKYPLEAVLAACQTYFERTGRRVTYEYAMMAGFNDSEKDARRLAALLGRGAHVNLIPLNAVKEHALSAPSAFVLERFAAILRREGVNATIRRSLGADIEGACGQLRRKYADDTYGTVRT